MGKAGLSLLTSILILACTVCRADPAQDLLNAIDKNNLSAARTALDAGANVNEATNNALGLLTITPLSYAVHHQATEIVKLLLERGANINAKDPLGTGTPLNEAAEKGYTEIAAMLLNKGADPEVRDETMNFTPLLDAAVGAHTEVAKLLLDHGASVDAASPDGVTPLFMAAGSGDATLVQLLLDRHADIRHRDNSGRTALIDAALCQKCTAANVKLLLARGAELEAQDNKGWTAFHCAQVSNNREIMGALVEAGANGGKMPAPEATALTAADKEFLTGQCKIEQQDIDVIPKLDDKVKQMLLSRTALRDCALMKGFVATREYFRSLKPNAALPTPPAGLDLDFLTDEEDKQFQNFLDNAPL